MFRKSCLALLVPLILLALIHGTPSRVTGTAFQQQEKETLFKQFNDKKRADPKDAYRVAKLYLERFGKDADDNTKYVKEWVVAYEAVISRPGTTDSNVTSPTRKPDSTAPSSTKVSDINGTTWQMKGKEDAKTWAEIFVFKPSGRFQYEKYGADGSSNVRAGTWRQLDESIFATLLGPDGNTTGTVRGELKGACLQATLVLQGQPEWRFLMETDTAPNACKDDREAEVRKESDPAYARKLFTDLINSEGKTGKGGKDRYKREIKDFNGCVLSYNYLIFDTDSVSTFTYRIPTLDIDPSTIQVQFYDTEYGTGYGVNFKIRNGQKTIKSHYDIGSTSHDSMEAEGGFSFENQENANRAARVLSQLVRAYQQNDTLIAECNEASRKQEEKERAEQAQEQAKAKARFLAGYEVRIIYRKELNIDQSQLAKDIGARLTSLGASVTLELFDYGRWGYNDHAKRTDIGKLQYADPNLDVAKRTCDSIRDLFTLEPLRRKDPIRELIINLYLY